MGIATAEKNGCFSPNDYYFLTTDINGAISVAREQQLCEEACDRHATKVYFAIIQMVRQFNTATSCCWHSSIVLMVITTGILYS